VIRFSDIEEGQPPEAAPPRDSSPTIQVAVLVEAQPLPSVTGTSIDESRHADGIFCRHRIIVIVVIGFLLGFFLGFFIGFLITRIHDFKA
jgi:ABC-type nitrate/sulfonate/bicarbonate transport system permease component